MGEGGNAGGMDASNGTWGKGEKKEQKIEKERSMLAWVLLRACRVRVLFLLGGGKLANDERMV